MSPVGDVHFYVKKTVLNRCRNHGVWVAFGWRLGGCLWCYIMVFMVCQDFGAFDADIAPSELVFAAIDS